MPDPRELAERLRAWAAGIDDLPHRHGDIVRQRMTDLYAAADALDSLPEPDAWAVRLPNGEMLTDPSGRVLTYPTPERAEKAAAVEVYEASRRVVPVHFGKGA